MFELKTSTKMLTERDISVSEGYTLCEVGAHEDLVHVGV
jgi:hypothetical protein